MTESIEINVDRLTRILAELKEEKEEAHTTDIIDRYMGGFHSNKGVPVSDSWNAQFGKYLKSHQKELKICEVAPKQRVVRDGDVTTASLWSLLPCS